jgi:hypothetical protein
MLRPTSLSHLLWAFLALTGIVGCEPVEPNGDGVAELLVRTDKPAYSLAVDRAATATLFNQGRSPIYAPMNEYVYVEQWSENGWINRSPWFVIDGTEVSFPIAPGDSLVALPMNFGYVNNRAGVYRFVFEVALDPFGRRLVPEDQRVSEPFEVSW